MPTALPSLNGLRAFETTARLGSLTQAAMQLHVTTSAVSHLLRRLETELGVKLFQREASALVLTEVGRSYYSDVGPAFERLEAATAGIFHRPARAVVQVTVMPIFGVKWLVPRLSEFYQKHRNIDVHIATTTRVIDLHRSDDDLAIRFGNGVWPGLTVHRLLGESVQPVVSPSLMRTIRKKRWTPSDILRVPLIHAALRRNDWRIWARQYGLEFMSSSTGLRFDEPLAATQGAIDGHGAALGLMALLQEDLAAGRLVAPLADPIPLTEGYYLAHTERLLSNPAAVVFKNWLIATADRFARNLPNKSMMRAKVSRG